MRIQNADEDNDADDEQIPENPIGEIRIETPIPTTKQNYPTSQPEQYIKIMLINNNRMRASCFSKHPTAQNTPRNEE